MVCTLCGRHGIAAQLQRLLSIGRPVVSILGRRGVVNSAIGSAYCNKIRICRVSRGRGYDHLGTVGSLDGQIARPSDGHVDGFALDMP